MEYAGNWHTQKYIRDIGLTSDDHMIWRSQGRFHTVRAALLTDIFKIVSSEVPVFSTTHTYMQRSYISIEFLSTVGLLFSVNFRPEIQAGFLTDQR